MKTPITTATRTVARTLTRHGSSRVLNIISRIEKDIAELDAGITEIDQVMLEKTSELEAEEARLARKRAEHATATTNLLAVRRRAERVKETFVKTLG